MAPRDVPGRDASKGEPTIHKLPLEIEELLERVEPDFLGFDFTKHSDDCYTIIILTLDYHYRAFRAHRSLDWRWTVNPLDWAGNMDLVIRD